MAAHLEQQIESGGLREAAVRALLYIRMPDGVADERGFAALPALRHVSCRQPNASA